MLEGLSSMSFRLTVLFAQSVQGRADLHRESFGPQVISMIAECPQEAKAGLQVLREQAM
jgi:hypothetical protein